MCFFKYLIDRLFRPKTLVSASHRAGYVGDQIGIRNRYFREKANWQPHLDNTSRFILESAKSIQHRGSVAVLGSGWLYDVPVDELSAMFDEVCLVDIVHPESVKSRVGGMPNVRLVTCDLTGGAVQMAFAAHSFYDFVRHLDNARLSLDIAGFDFVVSVNLLNQLDILLCDYLKERFRVSDGQLRVVREKVQQRHVDALPKGRSCLVADYVQIDSPVDGSPATETNSLYCQMPKYVTFKEWIWLFDTKQRYSVKNNTSFKVMAVCF